MPFMIEETTFPTSPADIISICKGEWASTCLVNSTSSFRQARKMGLEMYYFYLPLKDKEARREEVKVLLAQVTQLEMTEFRLKFRKV